MFVLKVIYHMSEDFREESLNFGGISCPNSSEIKAVCMYVCNRKILFDYYLTESYNYMHV